MPLKDHQLKQSIKQKKKNKSFMKKQFFSFFGSGLKIEKEIEVFKILSHIFRKSQFTSYELSDLIDIKETWKSLLQDVSHVVFHLPLNVSVTLL